MAFDYGKGIDITGTKLFDLIKFYVFMCPVENQSKASTQNGKTLAQLGIKRDALKRLLARMKEESDESGIFHFTKNNEDIVQTFEVYCNSTTGDVIAINPGDCNQAGSIFLLIRCAFAHGAFQIEKRTEQDFVYYFEKRNKKDTVNALARIHEDTLIKWISLFDKKELRKLISGKPDKKKSRRVKK